MNDKKETFGGELAKNLPVKEIYNDVAHPALSTIGKTLQGATRVALAPISAMIWGYDKIAGYLDVAIPEYFARKKIKEENIKSPDPSIAGPVIEAMRYTSHKPELIEMFTNVLGASMNSESYDEHPAFVEIIKQLCSDECKMLKQLRTDDVMPMIKQRLSLRDNGDIDIAPYFSDICYLANCEYPQKFPEYLDNLHRLGLVIIEYDRWLVNDQYYIDLLNNPNYIKVVPAKDQKIIEKKSLYKLSDMGKKFCTVCMD